MAKVIEYMGFTRHEVRDPHRMLHQLPVEIHSERPSKGRGNRTRSIQPARTLSVTFLPTLPLLFNAVVQNLDKTKDRATKLYL